MVFAGLLLVGGSLADRFGRKRLFLVGLAIFGAGSVGAAMSGSVDTLLVRAVGVKLTVAAGLAAIAGALWQISAASTPVTAYGDILPGILLVGLGAGLLIPTSTNSVVGSVPRGDSGIGSAANAVALQVGGALGVAVIGSLLSTRYQDHITSALAGHHVPAAAAQDIVGSIGGALAVAASIGGATGGQLAQAARAACMSGTQQALAVAAFVAAGGALLVLARLPSRATKQEPDIPESTTEGQAEPPPSTPSSDSPSGVCVSM